MIARNAEIMVFALFAFPAGEKAVAAPENFIGDGCQIVRVASLEI